MPQVAQRTFQFKEAPKPNGQCKFYIYGYPKGKREVHWFRTETEAKAEMKRLNDQIYAFGVNATVSGVEIRTIRECAAMLEPYGKSVYDAVHHYISYLKEKAKSISISLMSEKVRAEFRRQAGSVINGRHEISKGHTQNMMQALNGLVAEFGERNANEVSCNQLKMCIAEEDWSIKTKNNRLGYWRLAFETAKDLEIIAANPMADLKKFKNSAGKEIVILTPEQTADLLNVADPLALPSLVIGAFAGVRRSERLQMDWSMIDLEKARITLPPTITKTREGRRIEMMPNLIEWLRPLAHEGNLVEVSEDKHDKLIRDAKQATALVNGEDDFQNALRRSFITYFRELTGSDDRTIRAAGHSHKTDKEYCSIRVEKEQAERYFAIRPKPTSPTNIIQMTVAA
jgi:integrase